MFVVIGTETYLQQLKKWPKADRESAEKLPKHLAENPLAGKPLNYPYLREKRVSGRRIYYLIYPEFRVILLVAVSGKKDQQDTIDHIRMQLEEYKIIAERISKQVS